MKTSEITNKDAILCKTKSEFQRLLVLFNLDPEFMDWDFYTNHTVLYPLKNQYGCKNGHAYDKGFNLIDSTLITNN